MPGYKHLLPRLLQKILDFCTVLSRSMWAVQSAVGQHFHWLIPGMFILYWTWQAELQHLVCLDASTSHAMSDLFKSLWSPKLVWYLVMNTRESLPSATADLFLSCAIQGKSCQCNKICLISLSLLCSRVTILVKLHCETNQEVHYLPGEHIGIFPGNQAELVQGIIARVKDAPPADQTIRLETCIDGKLGLFRQNNRGCWTDSFKIPKNFCWLSLILWSFSQVSVGFCCCFLVILIILGSDFALSGKTMTSPGFAEVPKVTL